MNNQLSISKSIVLHLLPGAIGTLVYLLLAPLFLQNGYPAILALLVSAGAVIVPIELVYLLIQAKKNGSFGKVIEYREALPRWQYFVLPLGMIVWGFLASGALSILDLVTAKQIFGWLPGWFFIFDLEQFKAFPREALLITFWAGLFINGLIGPVVEELYFRGYLLPRLSRLGNWSPLINISLFSLYHFWTPWQFISRIIWLLPWGYLVQKKKNIYLMMIAHCTANILGWLLVWGAILNA